MGRRNTRQAQAAHAALQDFIRPLLANRGDRSTLGWVRAEAEGAGRALARQYADRYARMLRGNGSFPEAMTLWGLGCGLERLHRWCAAPLVIFGGGHLAAFVDVIASADRNVIPATRLEQLVRAAPSAIGENWPSRRIWMLSTEERTAFDPPDKAALKARSLQHDDVLVARVIAEAHHIGIDVQRRAVAEHLVRWLRDPERQQLELFNILEYGARRVEGFA
jgi:hypothetical protein